MTEQFGSEHRAQVKDAPYAPFLAETLLTALKPRLKQVLRPVAAKLVGVGLKANEITLASLVGSISVGALLCAFPANTALFVLLPLWLPMRTACAAIDGTMAIDFGQKSSLGGVLNEVGDIASDAALMLPLAFVAPFSLSGIVLLIVLTTLTELAGIAGGMLGSDRRLEGPLGKIDRSFVLAMLGLVIALEGHLPRSAGIFVPLFCAGLLLTIWNRVRFALADARSGVHDA